MPATEPFRMNPSLGPNLHQVVRASSNNGVWYDTRNIVSPQIGDTAWGSDGYKYIFVRSTGAIATAAAPGTQVTLTGDGQSTTAAAGAGGFYAPPNTVMTTAIASGDCFWARKGTK